MAIDKQMGISGGLLLSEPTISNLAFDCVRWCEYVEHLPTHETLPVYTVLGCILGLFLFLVQLVFALFPLGGVHEVAAMSLGPDQH